MRHPASQGYLVSVALQQGVVNDQQRLHQLLWCADPLLALGRRTRHDSLHAVAGVAQQVHDVAQYGPGRSDGAW